MTRYQVPREETSINLTNILIVNKSILFFFRGWVKGWIYFLNIQKLSLLDTLETWQTSYLAFQVVFQGAVCHVGQDEAEIIPIRGVGRQREDVGMPVSEHIK